MTISFTDSSDRALLVIGSEGFVGQALVQRARARGHTVVGASHRPPTTEYDHQFIDRQSPDFRSLIRAIKPAAVILAAATGSVGRAQSEPGIAFRDTCGSLAALIAALREFTPNCRLVHMSSMAVYGNARLRPTPETERPAPLSVYGRLKTAAEWQCRRASRDAGIPTCSLRVASLYGRGQRKQLFWDMARRLVRNPDELTLFGDGCETRDFVQIDDFADIVFDLIESAPFEGEAINIGTGTSLTIRAAAEQLCRHFDFRGALRFLGESPPHDPKHFEADVSLMKSLTTRRPRQFADGIADLAGWLKAELAAPICQGAVFSSREV